MDQIAKKYLASKNDTRGVIGDPYALFFGTEINDQSLVPGYNARIGSIRYDD